MWWYMGATLMSVSRVYRRAAERDPVELGGAQSVPGVNEAQ